MNATDEAVEVIDGSIPRFAGVTYVIPCGGKKLDHAAPARELYIGSMFRHTLSCVETLAADTVPVTRGYRRADGPARVLILSAKHGLVHPDWELEPYDQKMGKAGSIAPAAIAVQAMAFGIHPDSLVTAFLPKAYFKALDEALRLLGVVADDVYEDLAGLLQQKQVNAIVARASRPRVTAPTPASPNAAGPTVWIGGDVSAFWWGVPLLVSYGRLRDAKSLPVATAPWVLDSRGFNEINDFGRWTIDQAQYIADCRRYRDEIGMLQWVAPQDWPAGAHLLARTGLSETEHQERTIASVVGMRAAAPDLDVITVVTAKDAAGYLRHIDMYARAGIDLRAERLPIGVGALVGRPPSEAADIIRVLHAAGLRRMHGFGVKGEVLDLVGDLIDSFDSADWSGEIRRAFRRGGALDLCPHGLVKYERNCPRAAVAWSKEQAERAGRALVQQSLPLFDIPV